MALGEQLVRRKKSLPHGPADVFGSGASKIGEWLTPPQIDRRAQQCDGPFVIALVGSGAGGLDQATESVVVDQFRIDAEPVRLARHPDESVRQTGRPQHGTSAADQGVQVSSTGIDRPVSPQVIDDHVDGHRGTLVIEQQRQ
ncbi:hypothetical protein ABNF97_30990 [Plantactinospora sp. B6F1]|uniref:hypothetical protein n=1 Tax=Plantactinospora sp. B6F1 TaxID=3158971 RepID=UPI0032D915FB